MRDQETIIVAMSVRHRPQRIVRRLVEQGHEVVGPATTAGMALALAATTRATLALVDAELDGRRDGVQLASRLERSWGLPSLLVSDADLDAVLSENRLVG